MLSDFENAEHGTSKLGLHILQARFGLGHAVESPDGDVGLSNCDLRFPQERLAKDQGRILAERPEVAARSRGDPTLNVSKFSGPVMYSRRIQRELRFFPSSPSTRTYAGRHPVVLRRIERRTARTRWC